jgi:SAM-dependent methyltransferase
MPQAIRLNYGDNQYLLSERMQAFPSLGKLLNRTMGYTNIGNYARAQVFSRHINKIDLSKVTQVLDLGCGYGENAIMMSKALTGKDVFALDIDQRALSRIRLAKNKLNLGNLTVHEGKIDTLTVNDLDLIYSVDLFEHIPEKEMPFAEAKCSALSSHQNILKNITNGLTMSIPARFTF